MYPNYSFTDKNRDYRTYPTISDDDGNNYSKILFHKVRWSLGDHSDIKELQDIWAEDIMQSIIDSYIQGDFQATINLENDDEEYCFLNWEVMSAWNGMN
jgi:hypothetical protein